MSNPDNPRPLVIAHADCRDGFGASWICQKYLHDRNPEFHYANYTEDPVTHLCYDRDVYIVDFCYKFEDMLRIEKIAKTLTVIDHHKSADWIKDAHWSVFDLNRSGAGLTWDYFYPGMPRPWIINYVEDRDLWRKALPDSEVVNAYLSTLPLTFEAWDNVMAFAKSFNGWQMILMGGGTALNQIKRYVEDVKKTAVWLDFEGYYVPFVNAARPWASELLHALVLDGAPFAVGWSMDKDGEFNYSLRSDGNTDVEWLANKFGGGGHKAAAGFHTNELITHLAIKGRGHAIR